jgi:hypothetical protein
MAQFIGFRCQAVELLNPETSHETPPAGTVKRLNVEHPTSNIERRILMTLRFI